MKQSSLTALFLALFLRILPEREREILAGFSLFLPADRRLREREIFVSRSRYAHQQVALKTRSLGYRPTRLNLRFGPVYSPFAPSPSLPSLPLSPPSLGAIPCASTLAPFLSPSPLQQPFHPSLAPSPPLPPPTSLQPPSPKTRPPPSPGVLNPPSSINRANVYLGGGMGPEGGGEDREREGDCVPRLCPTSCKRSESSRETRRVSSLHPL